MRYILIILSFLVCLNAKDVKVATYNVENLFDAYVQGSEYPDFKPGHNGWDKKMANIKLKNTAKAIKLIDADIIGLQEIENRAILKKLASLTNYPYISFTKPYGSPVGVGVMSKYPIKSEKTVASGIKKTRDFLHANIDIDGNILSLWVVHFPTMKYARSKRLKVAKNLKRAIEKSGDREVLAVGDFNTNISNGSILRDAFGSLNSKNSYYDPWNGVLKSQRYSEVYRGHKGALDRMIMSQGMFDGRGLEFKKGSFRAVKRSFLSTSRGYPNRWKTSRRRHQGAGYSDHFPLVLSLNISNIKQTANAYIKPKLSQPIPKVQIEKNIATIGELFKLPLGDTNSVLKNVKVVYKNSKNDVIFSQNKDGIYVYKPPYNLNKGDTLDILVTKIGEYRGMREIMDFKILKRYPKTTNLQKYMKDISNLNNLRAGDVIRSVDGELKGKFLYTKYGKIKLYDTTKSLRNSHVKLHEVRVGLYRGKNELVVEERE